MKYLEERNRKIVDAIINKAEIVCPGALALIGIYGSFMTGEYNEKSDLFTVQMRNIGSALINCGRMQRIL